ncbi:mannitol dehydrogenase family protein [Rhizobium sp. SAFR-030]|uniref:mannitol dehydrogenase family protein n=1 Tax=Rhizobium sp. SAFR-030 TaxID=3387277 RepID=UPI003F7F35FB
MNPAPIRSPAILQFGTSRFLLAHADLFISEAMERGEALGPIAVVQTTSSAESADRIAALRQSPVYPVRIRGIDQGRTIDEERTGSAIVQALTAAEDWQEILELGATVQAIISNTGDRGYDLDPSDDAALLSDPARVPKSFPAKMAILLAHRFKAIPQAPLSIFPCELVPQNGSRLRTLIEQLAMEWDLPVEFRNWLHAGCHFANSLVDRIVAEPISPVGAVAEPYALWAIQAQEGLVLPCQHPAIVVTDDLERYEMLKLHLLNLGHTMLAEHWLTTGRAPEETVREAMDDQAMRDELEAVWHEEVLPVFKADGMADEAALYIDSVRDRFRNPFLRHRLSDIAANHDEKKRRRLLPMVTRAADLGLAIPQLRLKAALARTE